MYVRNVYCYPSNQSGDQGARKLRSHTGETGKNPPSCNVREVYHLKNNWHAQAHSLVDTYEKLRTPIATFVSSNNKTSFQVDESTIIMSPPHNSLTY